MLVAREETFGPVAPLFQFKDRGRGDRHGQRHRIRPGCLFVHARSRAELARRRRRIEYGIVGVNTGIISTEVAPFGGVKESGNGREGSKYGILDYTEIKYVCVGGVS